MHSLASTLPVSAPVRLTPMPVQRTPPNSAPRHRNMPTPRRSQETLPPASLKPAIDLSHF